MQVHENSIPCSDGCLVPEIGGSVDWSLHHHRLRSRMMFLSDATCSFNIFVLHSLTSKLAVFKRRYGMEPCMGLVEGGTSSSVVSPSLGIYGGVDKTSNNAALEQIFVDNNSNVGFTEAMTRAGDITHFATSGYHASFNNDLIQKFVVCGKGNVLSMFHHRHWNGRRRIDGLICIGQWTCSVVAFMPLCCILYRTVGLAGNSYMESTNSIGIIQFPVRRCYKK